MEHVGYLLTNAFVHNLLTVSHALRDVNIENLWLLNNFLSFAQVAVLLIDSTFALALITRLLHLHLHESHILDHFDLTSSFTLSTILRLSAFSATALAFAAVDVPLDRELFLSSIVYFLKGNFQVELVFRALHAVVSSPFVTFNFIDALLVVNLTLGVVKEHFLSPVDLGELLSCFFITRVFVGMVL